MTYNLTRVPKQLNAVAWGSVFAFVNIVQIVRLLLERSEINFTEEEMVLPAPATSHPTATMLAGVPTASRFSPGPRPSRSAAPRLSLRRRSLARACTPTTSPTLASPRPTSTS